MCVCVCVCIYIYIYIYTHTYTHTHTHTHTHIHTYIHIYMWLPVWVFLYTYTWENTWEEPKWLSEKSIHDITNFDFLLNSRSVHAKNPDATILFINFSKAFDTIHRGKMEYILLTYGLPNETVPAIMMQYKDKKVKVCSPDGDTDYFDIVVGVLWVAHISLIPVYYLLRLCAENFYKFNERKTVSSRRYPEQTIMNADYANDIALLANTHAQDESQTRMSSRWHRCPCQCQQDRTYALL